MNFRIVAILLLCVFVFSGCAANTAHRGIGKLYYDSPVFHKVIDDSTGQYNQFEEIEVLSLGSKEALDVLYEVVEEVFRNPRTVNMSYDQIVIFPIASDNHMRISIIGVENLDNPDEYGVIYEVEPISNYRRLQAILPKGQIYTFFKGLGKYRKEHDIKTLKFNRYRTLSPRK